MALDLLVPETLLESLVFALKIFLQSCTSFLNSSGSDEKVESGPPSNLLKVICFSIIVAPSVIAATATVEPIVWSERPIGTLNEILTLEWF